MYNVRKSQSHRSRDGEAERRVRCVHFFNVRMCIYTQIKVHFVHMRIAYIYIYITHTHTHTLCNRVYFAE